MKCTDKEWDTCQVEKMGCYGCYYDEHKIQVGYFVRTNQGIIGKIKRIELDKIDKALKWYVFDKKRPNMNIIDEIYTTEEVINKAITLAESRLMSSNKKIDKIDKVSIIKKEEYDSKIRLDLFISVIEEIGEVKILNEESN